MQTLLHRRSLSRAELAGTLRALARHGSALVHELEFAGVVAQRPQPDDAGEGRRGIGHPPLQISLSPQAAFAIGLDLGHNRVSAAMCDLAGEVLVTRTVEIPDRHDPHSVLDLAERLTLQVLDEARVEISKVLGVGVGLAAPVSSASGEIYAADILPAWRTCDRPSCSSAGSGSRSGSTTTPTSARWANTSSAPDVGIVRSSTCGSRPASGSA